MSAKRASRWSEAGRTANLVRGNATRQRNPVDLDSAVHCVLVEEPKCADALNVRGELYPLLIEQEQLVGANLFGAELVGRFIEVLRKIGNTADVGSDC